MLAGAATGRYAAGMRLTGICRRSSSTRTPDARGRSTWRPTAGRWPPAAATASSRSGTWQPSLRPGRLPALSPRSDRSCSRPTARGLPRRRQEASCRSGTRRTGREQGDGIRWEATEIRLAFSPGGQTLAMLPVGSGQESLSLWDCATERGARPPWSRPARRPGAGVHARRACAGDGGGAGQCVGTDGRGSGADTQGGERALPVCGRLTGRIDDRDRGAARRSRHLVGPGLGGGQGNARGARRAGSNRCLCPGRQDACVRRRRLDRPALGRGRPLAAGAFGAARRR